MLLVNISFTNVRALNVSWSRSPWWWPVRKTLAPLNCTKPSLSLN